MSEPINLSSFLSDGRALAAIVIVAASFLPFIGGGTTTTSLINVQSQVNAANQALGTMGAMLGPGMGSVGQMTGSLNLGFPTLERGAERL